MFVRKCVNHGVIVREVCHSDRDFVRQGDCLGAFVSRRAHLFGGEWPAFAFNRFDFSDFFVEDQVLPLIHVPIVFIGSAG